VAAVVADLVAEQTPRDADARPIVNAAHGVIVDTCPVVVDPGRLVNDDSPE